jgi:hypothetical protein
MKSPSNSLISLFPLSAIILVGGVSSVSANQQTATLTQVQGDVKIFTNPGKAAQGPAPHALYEGLYYSVRDAQPGEKID